MSLQRQQPHILSPCRQTVRLSAGGQQLDRLFKGGSFSGQHPDRLFKGGSFIFSYLAGRLFVSQLEDSSLLVSSKAAGLSTGGQQPARLFKGSRSSRRFRNPTWKLRSLSGLMRNIAPISKTWAPIMFLSNFLFPELKCSL